LEMSMSRVVRISVSLALFTLLAVSAWSQGIFATLTGLVTDPSGAVVSGAKVTLVDATSGSTRETTTNSDGYYAFASVPVVRIA